MPLLGKGKVAGKTNKLKNNLSPIPCLKQFGNCSNFTGNFMRFYAVPFGK